MKTPSATTCHTVRSFRRGLLPPLLGCALFAGVAIAEEPAPATPSQPGNPTFVMTPIGRVAKTGSTTKVILEEAHEPGLLGLDGWSHVWVFWWFDRNDNPRQRSILQVHPRGDRDNPLSGVFATRSPVRPNLIALSLCKIVSVKGNIVEIESIDAFDGTPVIDLKPYSPGADAAPGATAPDWARRNPPRPEADTKEPAR